MEYFITYFQNVRYLTEEYIVIDTSIFAPKWLDPSNGKRQYVNEHNVLIGIKEESFLMTEDEIKKNKNVVVIPCMGNDEYKYALEISYENCTGCG